MFSFQSKKEAFHFLAEIENDALTPELEENVKEIFDILLRKGCQINATDRVNMKIYVYCWKDEFFELGNRESS